MLERIQINFTPTQIQRLKEESERTGVSVAGLVRLAVESKFKEAQ